ncbi:MAG: hypothetical protein C5B50_22405 [Verrucomicrobia bacterium]|nr:MAG: hypothetical protein C5B50_22405 [Verrucomicrobiota bacterium]
MTLRSRQHLLWTAAFIPGAGGGTAICASLAAVPGPGPHREFILGFVLLGLAAALAQAAKRKKSSRQLGASEPAKRSVSRSSRTAPADGRLGESSPSWSKKIAALPAALERDTRLFWLSAVLLGIAQSSILYWCGMRQLGGSDHGFLVDTGWRLAQGQRPYMDFPCTVPPGFYLGAGFAFKLFGMSWSALIRFTALFSLSLFLWSVWLGWRLFGGRGFVLLLALVLQSLSLLLVSCWLYNAVTSAAAGVFLLAAALLWHRPADARVRCAYVAALVLLALMKPNMAGVLIALVTIGFFCSRSRRLPAILLSGGGFVVFLLILWFNGIKFFDLLQSYFSVASHAATPTLNAFGLYGAMGLPDLAFYLFLYLLIIIGILLLVIGAAEQGRPSFFARGYWIGICGIAAVVNPFLVNGENKLVDLVPAAIGAVLLTPQVQIGVGSAQPFSLVGSMRRLVSGVLLVLVFTGTGLAMARDRVRMIGYGAFFEYETRPAVPDGFFKGLHAGAALRETLDQMRCLLAKTGDATVFFGPRLEWAYAAFQKPSPLNQPICWDPGLMFAEAQSGPYCESLRQKRYDIVILSRNEFGPADLSYYSAEFAQLFTSDYIYEGHYSRLTVGVRGIPTTVLRQGNVTNAIAEFHRMLTKDPDLAPVLSDLAWIRATHPQAEVRNGAEAVKLAERACQLTDYKNAAFLGTLGAAYAEDGRFEEAVATAEKARAMSEASGENWRAAKNEERIRLFKAHQAYRDKW